METSPDHLGDVDADVEPAAGDECAGCAITSAHGVLVFPDEATAQQTVTNLAAMPSPARRRWEQHLGFTSQDTWYELINEAELQLEQERFGHLDKNLSAREVRDMGFAARHTSLYEDFLESGYIRELVEEDGARSFELVSGYPAFSSILTRDGYVVIGDQLRRYRSGALDLTTITDLDELAHDIGGLFDDATRANKQPVQSLTIEYSWSKDSGWVYDGTNKRFRIELVGDSIISDTSSLMTVNHYVFAEAQQKRWGSWKRRNNYQPIKSFSGEWDYEYTVAHGSWLTTLTEIPISSSYKPWLSPMKWTPVPGETTNYAKTDLSPHGVLSPGGYDYFYDPVYMLGLTVRGHFTTTTVTLTHGGGAITPPPTIYRLRHVSTGKCLYNTVSGNVHNWSCWADPSMRYALLPGYAGSVRLYHLDTGTCVAAGSTNGAIATSATCDPTATNQRFYLDSAGSGSVRLRSGSQCLYGTSTNGGTVHSWGCWSDPNMRFVLDPA